MTDAIEAVTETQEIDYKAWYDANLTKVKDFDSVVAKKDQLLNETKKVKAEREEATREAARIAEEKAKKEGDWDKLLNNAKQREENLTKELADIKNANKNERINNAALRIAGELADGDNIELLSEFIVRNLKQLSDDAGTLSVEALNEVKKDFATNTKYKSLLKSSKAVGGSAPGSMSSAQTVADLSKLSPVDRINAARAGKH